MPTKQTPPAIRVLRIPKRSGGTRLIYAPRRDLIAPYRALAAVCESVLSRTDGSEYAVAFRPGISCADAARRHIGKAYTLSMDLADFFDGVTAHHLRAAGLAHPLPNACCVDGAARQGLPSSPAAANLAATPLDRQIAAALPNGAVYTRYADDLCISADNLAELMHLRDAVIPAAVAAMGWRINQSKTRIQSAHYGRRIILGYAVDRDGVYPTRAVRRALRAARHRNPRSSRAAGMAEWASAKPARPRALAETPCGQALARATADKTGLIHWYPTDSGNGAMTLIDYRVRPIQALAQATAHLDKVQISLAVAGADTATATAAML